jgi:hypothetical protein
LRPWVRKPARNRPSTRSIRHAQGDFSLTTKMQSRF